MVLMLMCSPSLPYSASSQAKRNSSFVGNGFPGLVKHRSMIRYRRRAYLLAGMSGQCKMASSGSGAVNWFIMAKPRGTYWGSWVRGRPVLG